MSRFRSRPFPLRREWLPLAGLALTLACGRPLDRPLDGAQPLRAGEAPSRLVEPPPTVAPPQPSAVTSPAPIIIALGSPSPAATTTGRNPILSGLLPAPDALVGQGLVNIGARIAASSELLDVVLLLDGTPVQAQITSQDPRTWLVSYTGKLEIGKHEVRLNAKDRDGRAGGYRWQFEVEEKSPKPTAVTVPATPRPVPLDPVTVLTPVPRTPAPPPTPRPR